MRLGKSKKGFFFVLISFIMILYIYLYLNAWMNAIEISEKTSSEKFKLVSLKSVFNQINETKLNDFFSISGYYALFKINEHASNKTHPLNYNTSNELYYLNRSFFNASLFGVSQDFENTPLEYSKNEKDMYTFSAWINTLNKTLLQAGLEINSFVISEQNLTQVDPVLFNASMNISIFVQDRRASAISLNRTFHLNEQFNISGFPDPLIAREYQKINSTETVAKQIFYKNSTIASLSPINVINGTKGQGFFYGTLIETKDVTVNFPIKTLRPSYILVGTFSDITNDAIFNYTDFGAYILTNSPGNQNYDGCPDNSETDTFMAIVYRINATTGQCPASVENTTTKPFAIVQNFNITKFRGPSNEHRTLFISKYSVKDVNSVPSKKNHPVLLYDIENLRDVAVCGYYIHSTRAPSYAQRLSANALSLNSPFGIESFLIGMWAGGADLISYENYSRVDFEFFNKINGTKIRGMAGCKNYETCSAQTDSSVPLGHFSLSSDSITFYNLTSIACNNNMAGCDK